MVMMVMIILVISASAKAKLTGVSTEKLLGLLDKAELGDDESIAAMYMVGQGYHEGIGVEQDAAQAWAWWEKAAELGVGAQTTPDIQLYSSLLIRHFASFAQQHAKAQFNMGVKQFQGGDNFNIGTVAEKSPSP